MIGPSNYTINRNPVMTTSTEGLELLPADNEIDLMKKERDGKMLRDAMDRRKHEDIAWSFKMDNIRSNISGHRYASRWDSESVLI